MGYFEKRVGGSKSPGSYDSVITTNRLYWRGLDLEQQQNTI